MQERRTYIPQGWSKFYEFSYGDLKAGEQIIDNLVRSAPSVDKINWETLYGLFENVKTYYFFKKICVSGK